MAILILRVGTSKVVQTQMSWKKKHVLKLLSQDVFIANPSGGLHKSEVPQKHAP